VIDFHCHLDLYPNPKEVIAEADQAGIYVLSVTTTPKAWRGTAGLAKGAKRIRTALGLHPQIAHERLGELTLFEALGERTRFFGEVGLDGSPGHGCYAREQKLAFEHALRVAAQSGGKILTIHSRRAVDDVLATIARQPSAGPAILHWFSGTDRQLREAIAMGCWFSVGPAMLRSEKGRRLAMQMPRDRILTETDGPFAQAGGLPLRPVDSWRAVADLARLWAVDGARAGELLKSNLRSLLSLVPAPAHGARAPA
jgi:TatD DNase family protein